MRVKQITASSTERNMPHCHRRLLRAAPRRLNRTRLGNFMIFLVLSVFGIYSLLPMIMAINQSLKPMSELFIFPPRIFVQHPTLDNFRSLFDLMSTAWVPFSRYVFNTVFLSVTGTIGHIFIASMCAFPLAKFSRMPGNKIISALIVYSLMISPAVADIANFQTMSSLRLTDTYLSVLLPAFGGSFGLYIMKQFMGQLSDSLIEAARIDGAGDFRIYVNIIMPNVKPAWLTLALFSFQGLWNSTNSTYIFSEELKSLPYALNQIVSGGIIRAGAGAAVTVVLMVIPIVFFVVTQSNIMETMASSGLKE